MTGKTGWSNPVPVSDLAAKILDPVMRKRAGMSIALVQSWEEIVGPRLARISRPEKIRWNRRRQENEPYEPAVLVIACDGLAALHIQHQSDEILERANAFLGFGAIGRISIIQKPVLDTTPATRRPPEPLDSAERSRLQHLVEKIEDPGLRASLEQLGASVVGTRKRVKRSQQRDGGSS